MVDINQLEKEVAFLLARIKKAEKSSGGGELELRVSALENEVGNINETLGGFINDTTQSLAQLYSYAQQLNARVDDLFLIKSLIVPENAGPDNKLATMADIAGTGVTVLHPYSDTFRDVLTAVESGSVLAVDYTPQNCYAIVTDWRFDADEGMVFLTLSWWESESGSSRFVSYTVKSNNQWSVDDYPIQRELVAGNNIDISASGDIESYQIWCNYEDRVVGRYYYDQGDTSAYYEVLRKVVDFGQLPDNTGKTVPHGLPSGFKVLSLHGVAVGSNTIFSLPLSTIGADNVNNNIYLALGPTNITIATGRDRSNFNAQVFIDYYVPG